MKSIENVAQFFKRIFRRQSEMKMLNAPVEIIKEDNKAIFINSLKVNIVKKNKKNKVETPICVGDGLGIQTKISC